MARHDQPGDHLLNRLRNLLYFGIRYPWVKRGRNVHVQWSVRMWSPHRHIVIGDDVGILHGCVLQCDVEIGSQVLIAGNTAFVGSDDHLIDVVGKSVFFSGRGDRKKVVVEDDVWIGYGCVILSGARIGRGSVIGSGTVVVGDVPPYSIVIPQKGRVLRSRFTPEQIAEHERLLGMGHATRRPPSA